MKKKKKKISLIDPVGSTGKTEENYQRINFPQNSRTDTSHMT